MTPDLDIITLAAGSHDDRADGVCLLEAVAWVAGEPHSDHPECVCPVLAAFGRRWNDDLSDANRDRLLKPMIPMLIGTRSTLDVQERRAWMAADWLVRTHAVAWLRLAGLTTHADALAALPEIDGKQATDAATPAINAARDAAWVAATAAAEVAGRDAATAAAEVAGRDAAWDAATVAARVAARDAAWTAAWDAAWTAATAAASADKDLTPTVAELQASAVELLHRMIAVTA